MQKLVTIYLNDSAYNEGKMIMRYHPEKHGHVEEHLGAYLTEGWTILSVTALGGAGDMFVGGWVAVVLEKK